MTLGKTWVILTGKGVLTLPYNYIRAARLVMKTCRRYFYLSLVFERKLPLNCHPRLSAKLFKIKLVLCKGSVTWYNTAPFLYPPGQGKQELISLKKEFSLSSPCDFVASQDYGFQPCDWSPTKGLFACTGIKTYKIRTKWILSKGVQYRFFLHVL